MGSTFIFTWASHDSESATIAGTIVIMGIFLILSSKRRKKLTQDYKAYMMCLSIDPSGFIADLAKVTAKPQADVKKDLQIMINKKYFLNTYIDESQNRLVLPFVTVEKTVVQEAAEKVQQTTDIPITCQNCGGTSQVTNGMIEVCDFCGSPINFPEK